MSESRSVLIIYAKALIGFALIYLAFLGVYLAFPYLQPGDYLVADLKHSLAQSGNAFDDPKRPLRVMAFGWSKTLAGFVPAQFDREMASAGYPDVQSYNFGIAGDKRFVADLQAMASHGTAPDLALLTFPWTPAKQAEKSEFFHFIDNDQLLMARLFPFRHLIRDTFVLLAEGHGFSGMLRLYRKSQESVSRVAADRGYYFMASQSHYPNDRLPDDFRLPSDAPAALWADPERVVTLGSAYRQVADVLAAHRITCILVPLYFRAGEYAVPPPVDASVAELLKNTPNVSWAGPNYFLYPPNYFADPIHLNRTGAAAYTRDLSHVLAEWLKNHSVAHATR